MYLLQRAFTRFVSTHCDRTLYIGYYADILYNVIFAAACHSCNICIIVLIRPRDFRVSYHFVPVDFLKWHSTRNLLWRVFAYFRSPEVFFHYFILFLAICSLNILFITLIICCYFTFNITFFAYFNIRFAYSIACMNVFKRETFGLACPFLELQIPILIIYEKITNPTQINTAEYVCAIETSGSIFEDRSTNE